eukprot:jgi/Tetstr1/425790/TSEL_001573.t1
MEEAQAAAGEPETQAHDGGPAADVPDNMSAGVGSAWDSASKLENSVRATDLPRYAMPNITSMLPGYGNTEGEVIARAFHMANYDSISKLPTNLTVNEVTRARREAMEKARTMTVAPDNGKYTPGALTKNGMFSEFEYVPSEYNLYDVLENKAREESKAKIASIAGHEFRPVATVNKGKHEDGFQDGLNYPYLADPYEAGDEMALRLKWISDAQALAGPWSNPGLDKVGDRPTRGVAGEMMANIRKLIQEDWEDASIMIYPNEEELWVVRMVLDDGVDSVMGLEAYMNTFLRTNKLIQEYKLTKVVEHWSVQPGDGCVYYTFRPPWVAHNKLESFFTLHPEERNLRTLKEYREADSEQHAAAMRTLLQTERNWRGVVL